MTSLLKKEISALVLIAALVGAVLYQVYGLSDFSMKVPLKYAGDSDVVWNAALVKGIQETGWIHQNPRLGAPGQQRMFDYPLGGDHFHFLVWKVLGFATGNPFVVLNLFFLGGFFVIAFLGYGALRRLGIHPVLAVSVSVLYAFIPYHFMRGEWHIFLSAYGSVPLMFLLVLEVWDLGAGRLPVRPAGAEGRGGWLRRSGWILGLVLLGSSGSYYGIFAAFFLVVAGAVSALVNRKVLPLLVGGAFCMGVMLVLVGNLVPGVLEKSGELHNPSVGQRGVTESEFYGLKLSRLFLPTPGHHIGFLEKVRAQYPEMLGGEGTETLGAIGTLGFFGVFLLALWGWRQAPDKRSAVMPLLAALLVAAVFLATTGGLGSIVAYLKFPQIRAYNRMSIFIAWFSLAGFALTLEVFRAWFEGRSFGKRFSRPLLAGLSFGALGVGLYDQIGKGIAPDHHVLRQQVAGDRTFVRALEDRVPPGAMVFQLPYAPFPETPPLVGMADNDHLRMYVHSQRLRFSYGAMKGRGGDRWQKTVTSLPVERMAMVLMARGFSGVTVTRYGYADGGESVIQALVKLTGNAPLVHPEGNRVYIDFSGWRAKVQGTAAFQESLAMVKDLEGMVSDTLAVDRPIRFNDDAHFKKGWSGAEGTHRWTDGTTATVTFHLAEDFPKDPRGQWFLKPFMTMGSQDVVVLLNGTVLGSLTMDGNQVQKLALPAGILKERGPNRLEIRVPGAKSPGAQDRRLLAIALDSMGFVPNR